MCRHLHVLLRIFIVAPSPPNEARNSTQGTHRDNGSLRHQRPDPHRGPWVVRARRVHRWRATACPRHAARAATRPPAVRAQLRGSKRQSGTGERVGTSTRHLSPEARTPQGSGPFCFRFARPRPCPAGVSTPVGCSLTTCRAAAPDLAGRRSTSGVPRHHRPCAAAGTAGRDVHGVAPHVQRGHLAGMPATRARAQPKWKVVFVQRSRIPDLHSGDTGSIPVHDARQEGV